MEKVIGFWEKTLSLFLISYMSWTIKLRVIAYQSDGHKLPLEPTLW